MAATGTNGAAKDGGDGDTGRDDIAANGTRGRWAAIDGCDGDTGRDDIAPYGTRGRKGGKGGCPSFWRCKDRGFLDIIQIKG